jgi:hypothetical protein
MAMAEGTEKDLVTETGSVQVPGKRLEVAGGRKQEAVGRTQKEPKASNSKHTNRTAKSAELKPAKAADHFERLRIYFFR